MSGWKPKSAVPVEAPASTWKPKSAAPVVDAPPTAQPVPEEKTDAVTAFGRHFGQGATAKFSDEVLGPLAYILGPAAMDTPPEVLARWKSILSGGAGGLPTDASRRINSPEEGRDMFRTLNAQALKDQPAASMAGDIAGSIAVARKLPSNYGSAAAQGAAVGLGGSEQEDLGGLAMDSAIGTGLGAAGQAIGSGVAKGANALGRAVSDRAQRGLASARELAEAMAKTQVGKTIRSLAGEAGGAASRAGNILSNVDEIELPAEVEGRTIGALKESLAGQLAAMEAKVSEARARAVASGVDPDNLGAGRMGEFLSKGSKLDKAQQAAKKVQSYEAARDEVKRQLDELSGLVDQAPILDPNEALRKQQETVLADPRIMNLKANLLKNSLADLPAAADEAMATREALAQALSTRSADEAARAEALASPDAAKERMKELALRYGLPAVGFYLGSKVGGLEGAAVGAAAGAGTRPGFQALMRTAKSNPAVQTAAWKSVDWLASTVTRNPEALGKWSSYLARASAESPEALAIAHKVLSETDSEYAANAARAAQQHSAGRE